MLSQRTIDHNGSNSDCSVCCCLEPLDLEVDVPLLPLPLPLPTAVEGGGASLIAACSVLLDLNIELMSAGGFWLLYELLPKDNGIPSF